MFKFLFALFLFSAPTFASLIQVEQGSEAIQNVKLAKTAIAVVEGRKSSLTEVGAGLRIKKVVFVKAKVYVAQLFVADPTKYIRTNEGALESIGNQSSSAITLTFLRNVDGEKIKNSFKEAFEENKVKLEAPEIKAFLAAVSVDNEVREGQSLATLAEHLPEGKELISYENAKGKISSISGPPGFIKEIFGIWLGAPTDSGLENLKNALVSGKDEK